MWAKSFEDFDVFKKAYALSLAIHRATLEFPRIEQRGLADQIRRASKSICANLAEGFGKQQASKKEFKRFVAMAIGSADEMQVWLRYAEDLEYINWNDAANWRDGYKQVAQMLQGLHQSIKQTPSDI